MNMNIIDISWPISPRMTAYKNRHVVLFTSTKFFEIDQVRESLLTTGSHTGTHVDAPAHFMADGSTIDQTPLHALVGSCRVLDLGSVAEVITVANLESFDVQSGERLLLKTKNSNRASDQEFDPNFVYLGAEAAAWLATKQVLAVGIDYLGIERNQPAHETHLALLSNNIAIIEGLRLAQVAPGTYTLVCLPLLAIGLDGAPARAILMS